MNWPSVISRYTLEVVACPVQSYLEVQHRIGLEIINDRTSAIVADSVLSQDLMYLSRFFLRLALNLFLLAGLLGQVMLSLQQSSHELAQSHRNGASKQLRKSADDNDVPVVQDRETRHDGEWHSDAICDAECRGIKVFEIATVGLTFCILDTDYWGLSR